MNLVKESCGKYQAADMLYCRAAALRSWVASFTEDRTSAGNEARTAKHRNAAITSLWLLKSEQLDHGKSDSNVDVAFNRFD